MTLLLTERALNEQDQNHYRETDQHDNSENSGSKFSHRGLPICI